MLFVLKTNKVREGCFDMVEKGKCIGWKVVIGKEKGKLKR